MARFPTAEVTVSSKDTTFQTARWPSVIQVILSAIVVAVVAVVSFFVVNAIGKGGLYPLKVTVTSSEAQFPADQIRSELLQTRWDYPVKLVVCIGPPPALRMHGLPRQSLSSMDMLRNAYPRQKEDPHSMFVLVNPKTGEVAFHENADPRPDRDEVDRYTKPTRRQQLKYAVEDTLSYQFITRKATPTTLVNALIDYSAADIKLVEVPLWRQVLIAIALALLALPLIVLSTKALTQTLLARARGGRLAGASRRERRRILAFVRSVYNRASLSFDDIVMEADLHKELAKPVELWQRHYISLARIQSQVFDLSDRQLTSMWYARTLEAMYDQAGLVKQGMDSIVADGKRLLDSPGATVNKDTYMALTGDSLSADPFVARPSATYDPKPPRKAPPFIVQLSRALMPGKDSLSNEQIRFSVTLPPLFIAVGLIVPIVVGLGSIWLISHGYMPSSKPSPIDAGITLAIKSLVVVFIPGSAVVMYLRNRRYMAQQEKHVEQIFTSVVMSDDPIKLELMLVGKDYPDYAAYAKVRRDLWEDTIAYMSDVTGFGDKKRDISPEHTYALARLLALQMRSLWRTRALLENDVRAWRDELHLIVAVSGRRLTDFPQLKPVAANIGDDSAMTGIERLKVVEGISAKVMPVGVARMTYPNVKTMDKVAWSLVASGAMASQEAQEKIVPTWAPSSFSLNLSRRFLTASRTWSRKQLIKNTVVLVLGVGMLGSILSIEAVKPTTRLFTPPSDQTYAPASVTVIDHIGYLDEAAIRRAANHAQLPYPFDVLVMTEQCGFSMWKGLGDRWLTGSATSAEYVPYERVNPRTLVICVSYDIVSMQVPARILENRMWMKSVFVEHDQLTSAVEQVLRGKYGDLVAFSFNTVEGGLNQP